jgi:acyl dehydratase
MTATSDGAWPGGAPQVGQTAQMRRDVSMRDIELFTEISGDRNPLHYDEAYATATPFGGLVVQGGVSTAIINAVTLDFKAPVRPGDIITGEVEVTDVRVDKPIANVRVSVTRDDGVTAVEGTAVTWTMPPPM